jgi:hypothetical protein
MIRNAKTALVAACVILLVVLGSIGGAESATLTSPPELIFPGIPGAIGTTLPERACGDTSPSTNCAQEGGFDRSDYEGWSVLNGANERMQWVADPTGSGNTVAQFDVFGTDLADQFGGTRTSLWRNADNCSGCEAWQAWGTYIPANFQFPDGWFLLYQDFSSGGNPAQAIELRGAGCLSAIPRTELCWKDQTATNSGQHYFDLGPAQVGHWFYIIEDIKFLNTSAGFDKVWYAVDQLPDITQAPKVNWAGITAYTTGANRSNIMMYRCTTGNADCGSTAQHQTVMFCGFHRAATSAVASVLARCPLSADTTPPSVTINQATGQNDPTNVSPINFTVVFNEPVTGFSTGDVTLTGTAGATTATVTGSGTTYNVAVSGMTGQGTVIATIAAGVATDVAGNSNTASTSTDNTVTRDSLSPSVTIDQAAAQADPTGVSPINFTVVFSESVTGFATGDVTLGGTAVPTTGTVTGTGTTYNVAVSGMVSNGTVTASIDANKATDGAGNGNLASTSTDNTVTYDTQAPTSPTGLAISNPQQSSVDFSWLASSDSNGVAGYRVYLDGIQVADTQVLTVTVAGLSQPSHTLAVEAYDAAGNTSVRSSLVIMRSWR